MKNKKYRNLPSIFTITINTIKTSTASDFKLTTFFEKQKKIDFHLKSATNCVLCLAFIYHNVTNAGGKKL